MSAVELRSLDNYSVEFAAVPEADDVLLIAIVHATLHFSSCFASTNAETAS